MELKNKLLFHQREAVEKLSKIKVGALFMEQGTGKTITALELCRMRLEQGKIDRIIWLCPCSAKQNIKQEILKHAPDEILDKVTICGIETLSSSDRANVYLLDMVQAYRCYLVVDESLLVKNPMALRTKSILRLAERCTYKLILNGTPISRNEADLFSQMYLLDWRILGYRSYWAFAANHLEYDPNIKGKIIRCLNTDHLARKIAPYSYEKKKDECMTLPPKRDHGIPFHLTKEQWEHYEFVADELLLQLDEIKPETIYRLFSGVQAVACGRRVTFLNNDHMRSAPFFKDPRDNPRIQELLDLIDRINDEKCIIFCTYQSDVAQITELLNQIYGENSAVPFNGTLPGRKRGKAVESFRDGARFFVANRKCAGYSLNLQFCSNVIYYSNEWDLATYLQSQDRVHRYGQTKDVHIWEIYAAGTIDEKIQRSLLRKENLLVSFKEKVGLMDMQKIREFLNIRKGKERIVSTVYDCSNLIDVESVVGANA